MKYSHAIVQTEQKTTLIITRKRRIKQAQSKNLFFISRDTQRIGKCGFFLVAEQVLNKIEIAFFSLFVLFLLNTFFFVFLHFKKFPFIQKNTRELSSVNPNTLDNHLPKGLFLDLMGELQCFRPGRRCFHASLSGGIFQLTGQLVPLFLL